MAKRTIKPPAGESRVSLREATSAARVVYRDGTTGRFVILERDQSGRYRDRIEKGTVGDRAFKGIRKDKHSALSVEPSRNSSKKR